MSSLIAAKSLPIPRIQYIYIEGLIIAYSFPDGVVTEKTANLSKCHWPLSPGVLPTRKVVDAQIIYVGLIQLSVGDGERGGNEGVSERERKRQREREGWRERDREEREANFTAKPIHG